MLTDQQLFSAKLVQSCKTWYRHYSSQEQVKALEKINWEQQNLDRQNLETVM